MLHSLVITLIGPNKTGIINAVSKVIAQHSANWLDSHMANFAGQFAGIVHINVVDSESDALKQSLLRLNSEQLQICIADPTSGVSEQHGQLLKLALVGQDHPGIVKDISEALATNDISIEELETEINSGSMSGEMMFEAKALICVPPSLTIDELELTLQTVSKGLMVDVIIEDDA